MLVYLYDGSFEGLLTAFYEGWNPPRQAENILPAHKLLQPNLMDEYVPIETNQEKAKKVAVGIRTKLSPEIFENVFYCFLSELEGSDIASYQYLKLAFQKGSWVDMHLTDDRVFKVLTTKKKVITECHRMLGLLRFKKMAGEFYYASYEPDHHITPLISSHFKKRMADQHWIIHDVKRNVAVMYDQKDLKLVRATSEIIPKFDDQEIYYQTLWKEFFEHISIDSRVNPKLQKRNMPKRYWKHLTEKQDSI